MHQDKAAVLTDVRTIIAEQLGTDLDKVCRATMLCCVSPLLQVAPDSKFVDLGADSLDTVRTLLHVGCSDWTIRSGRDHDGPGGEV